MQQTLNWDDLRFFLSVCRRGSLAGAARDLDVNRSTVLRRVDQIEGALGLPLFDRLPGGFALTEAGEELLGSAQRVEDEVSAAARRISGRAVRPSGVVRVATTMNLGFGFLPPYLAAFNDAFPEIEIDLFATPDGYSPVSRHDADIAFRTLTGRSDIDMVGRRLCGLPLGVYGSSDYLARLGTPGSPADLPGHQIIVGDERMRYFGATDWLAGHAGPDAVVYRANSMVLQLAAVRAGVGLACLPCYLATNEPDLRMVLPLDPDQGADLWILTHGELRQTARVRAFIDFMTEAIVRDRHVLEGGGDV